MTPSSFLQNPTTYLNCCPFVNSLFLLTTWNDGVLEQWNTDKYEICYEFRVDKKVYRLKRNTKRATRDI